MSTNYIQNLTTKHAKPVARLISENKDNQEFDQLEVNQAIFQCAQSMTVEMPVNIHDKIWDSAGQVIGEDIDIGDECAGNVGYAITACMLLIALSPSVNVDPYSFGLSKYDEVCTNDWKWFAQQVTPYQRDEDIRFFYIATMNFETPNDSNEVHVLFQAKSREEAEIAHVKAAQAYLNGDFDSETQAFCEGEARVTLVKIVEVNEGFYKQVGTVFNFRRYKSIEEIQGNQIEVDKCLECLECRAV